MKRLVLAAALLTEGCSHVLGGPVYTAYSSVDMLVTMIHADDTPAQHLAWMQENYNRLSIWCAQSKGTDWVSCEHAKEIAKNEPIKKLK